MRHKIITLSLFLFSLTLFSQKPKKISSTSAWKDTTFVSVALDVTVKDPRVVAIDIGQKAIIYVNVKQLLMEAKAGLSNEFIRKHHQTIIHFLDSASSKSDTICIQNYYILPHLEYLVSEQLVEGRAKVFYKKQKSFVDTITYRLERYGGNADRFFYLPDKRPFFAIQEFSGIFDSGDDLLSKARYDAYVREGEKLQSLRKE
jgi:hypothetical protein